MATHFYQVAGHIFRLTFSDSNFNVACLQNYTPFLVAKSSADCLFHLKVVENLPNVDKTHLIGQFDDDIASIHISKSQEGHFYFQIARPGSTAFCTMESNASFQIAHVQLPIGEQDYYFCLNNCLMLLYAFASAHLHTLLIHASVIKRGEEGFIFLGKSGTGKSTHSRLWLQHIEGSELLNDDNPVVRIMEGIPKVFGSPWSGKTPCYRNDCALLKGIVQLRQAAGNKIKKLSSLQSYAALLPTCSSMRWEEKISTGVHQALEKLIHAVPCYLLECLPDKEAAELCAKTIIGN